MVATPLLSTPLLRSNAIPNLTYDATPRHFNQSWEAPLSTLLGLGRAAGADFIEFFLERVNYISCMAEDDAITSIAPAQPISSYIQVAKLPSQTQASI